MNGLSFPNLPTDTLYKFLTVFGLVILLFSFATPLILLKDNYVEKYKLIFLTKKLESENNNFKAGKLALDTIISSPNFQDYNKIFVSKKGNHIEYDSSNYRRYVGRLNERIYYINRINQTADSLFISQKQLENLYRNEERIVNYSNYGIVYGAIICLFGFILWFVNNQVYQDLFIKVQSGYKILPFKRKNSKQIVGESEDELYLRTWRGEIERKVYWFLIVLLVLLIVVPLVFEKTIGHGLYKAERVEVHFIDK